MGPNPLSDSPAGGFVFFLGAGVAGVLDELALAVTCCCWVIAATLVSRALLTAFFMRDMASKVR